MQVGRPTQPSGPNRPIELEIAAAATSRREAGAPHAAPSRARTRKGTHAQNPVLIARMGGRTTAGTELTATEERVAELVAQGLTNKAVAGELFVTDRTVEGHLSRIYAKLGVRSRAELARRFTLRN